MYKEIQQLYEMCQNAHIPCIIKPLFDVYKLLFIDGADMVQHMGSYGHKNAVEPAGFGCAYDYSAIGLRQGWELILQRYKA